MATHTVNRESFATRLGQSMGRGVGSMLRVERAVWSTLSRAGLPGIILTPVKWLARAVVVVGGTVLAAWGLLYILAVVAMVAIVVGLLTNPATDKVVRGAINDQLTDDGNAYRLVTREGIDGFGTYIGPHRID